MADKWTLMYCALALVVAAAAPARADTTNEFLAKCKTDPKGCQDYIFAINLMAKMDKAKRDLTCLPKGFDSAKVVKSITVWMSDRPELGDDPEGVTIEKAWRALYPNSQACRDTYVRADPFPPTAGEFLSYCAAEPANAEETCSDEIIGVGLRMRMDDPNVFCRLKADPGDRDAYHAEMVERVAAIRKWMADHPELSAEPRQGAIATAYTTLYPPPCAGG